jgi:hypothetical protein
MTYLLKSGTVGTSDTEKKEGEEIEVALRDENGNFIYETGIIEEVLD